MARKASISVHKWCAMNVRKLEKHPQRPFHSKPLKSPKYDFQLDARSWLRANGYQDLAERIDRLMKRWRDEGKSTRRDWWLVLAGSRKGVPSRAGGREWPMLNAVRRRQGYPVHSDGIERSPHELAPPIYHQKRWDSK